MVQTISSPLCEPMPQVDPVLKILLNITISNDGNFAFSRYSKDGSDYFTVNPKPRITIRYTPKDAPWEKHHQIIVTQRNIFQLKLGFKKFYNNFQQRDLYRYDDYGKIIEINTTDKDIVIISLGLGQLLRLIPTVVTDNRNNVYPGVNLTLNKEENQADLSIDEFEGIYDLFTTINLYQSGLTLLQTYIGMRKVSIEDTINSLEKRQVPKTTQFKNGTGSIFDQNREGFVSGPPKIELPKTLDDL